MNSTDLIKALKNLKVQTGSLACLGCGWEHNCSTQGCRDHPGGGRPAGCHADSPQIHRGLQQL